MTWLTISLTDLNDYLVGAQVNALNSAALAAGQSARFTNIMTDTVNRIRVKIETCPRNAISATPLTVPPELKWVACYLIIEALQAAIPGLQLTADQRGQIAKAEEQLDRIADGRDVVSRPDDPLVPADVQRGGQPAHPATVQPTWIWARTRPKKIPSPQLRRRIRMSPPVPWMVPAR